MQCSGEHWKLNYVEYYNASREGKQQISSSKEQIDFVLYRIIVSFNVRICDRSGIQCIA